MVKMGIKKQALLLILSCSFATFLLAGSIALYGMIAIRSSAVETGMEIGQSAAENSSEVLKEDAQTDMMLFLHERSRRINLVFENIGTSVDSIAKEMTFILQHPGSYAPRPVEEPSMENAGKVSAQLLFSPAAPREDPALLQEIRLSGNIQDWLIRLRLDQTLVAGSYIASKNGFAILVDARSEKKIDPATNASLDVDLRSRPWYQDAKNRNGMVFSNVFQDRYGAGLSISCATPYYGPNGEFAGVVGAGMLLKQIDDMVLRTKIGDTGFGFVMDREGRVLFSPKQDGDLKVGIEDNRSLFHSSEGSLAEAAKHMAAGETGLGEVIIDGIPCYLAYSPLNAMGCSFGIVMQIEEATLSADMNTKVIQESTNQFLSVLDQSIRSTLLGALTLVLFFLLLIPFLSGKIAERFVRPIHQLSDGVREIASGNLNKKIELHTGNEIEHLAACFNAMTDELQRYMEHLTHVTAEKERIATELSVATHIQESMLPSTFPPFPDHKEFDIYATMHAAKEVGGDFYDFYLLDENHLIVTIADVSGKGVPAALFMVVAKTILKNFAQTITGEDDLSALVSCTNDQLSQNNDAMMFVTAFVCMLNTRTGDLSFVNAGHNPPLLYRASEGAFRYLDVKRNCVMGTMEGLPYREQKLTLAPGDQLFLYTDGVTEALNEGEELYGEERLETCLNQSHAGQISLKELLEAVRHSLDQHVGSAEQSDDITMLALTYRG